MQPTSPCAGPSSTRTPSPIITSTTSGSIATEESKKSKKRYNAYHEHAIGFDGNLESKPSWVSSEGVCFPIHPVPVVKEFRERLGLACKKIHQLLQEIILCANDASSAPMTTNLEMVCMVSACFQQELPVCLPLSILTSATASRCLPSGPSTSLNLQDKQKALKNLSLCTDQLNSCVRTIVLDFRTFVSGERIQEVNSNPQDQRTAFLKAVSFLLFDSLEEHNCLEAEIPAPCNPLSEYLDIVSCISSMADFHSDTESRAAQTQLVQEVLANFLRAQSTFTSSACHALRRLNLPLPKNAKELFEKAKSICTATVIASPCTMDLLSWEEVLFRCLATIFLAERNEILPYPTDTEKLEAAVQPHFPSVVSAQQRSRMVFLTEALAKELSQQRPEAREESPSKRARISNPQIVCKNGFLKFKLAVMALNTVMKTCFFAGMKTSLSLETQDLFSIFTEDMAAMCPQVPYAKELTKLSFLIFAEKAALLRRQKLAQARIRTTQSSSVTQRHASTSQSPSRSTSLSETPPERTTTRRSAPPSVASIIESLNRTGLLLTATLNNTVAFLAMCGVDYVPLNPSEAVTQALALTDFSGTLPTTFLESQMGTSFWLGAKTAYLAAGSHLVDNKNFDILASSVSMGFLHVNILLSELRTEIETDLNKALDIDQPSSADFVMRPLRQIMLSQTRYETSSLNPPGTVLLQYILLLLAQTSTTS